MKKVLSVCFIFAAVAILTRPVFGSMSRVNVFVEATGVAKFLSDQSSSGDFLASISGSVSASFEGPPPGYVSASGTASALLTKSSDLQLSSLAFAQGGDDNPFGPYSPNSYAEVGANFMDALTLTPPSLGRLPAYITFNLSASGSIINSECSDPGHPAEICSYGRVRVGFSGNGVAESVQDNHGGLTTVSVKVPPSSSGRVDFAYSLVCIAGAQRGIGAADYSRTAVISSILLPDGFTPESQGYTLTFDSGMRSPNLAPLPGTGALLLSGLLLLAAGRRRVKP